MLVTLLGLGASAARADACPNAQFRVGPSANLPDCRAYELVTPADKGDTEDIFAGGSATDQAVASVAGGRVALESTAAKYGSSPGPLDSAYVFERTSSGWEMASVHPAGNDAEQFAPQVFAPDLSQLGVDSFTDTASVVSPDQTLQLGPPGGPYTTIASTPFNPFPSTFGDQFMGATPDFSHVVLASTDHTLVSSTPTGTVPGAHDLYEWTGGTLRLVNVTTAGLLVSACGATLGFGSDVAGNHANHAISSDGSKIFFEAPDPDTQDNSDPSCWGGGSSQVNPPQLYMRLHGTSTVELSAPAPGVSPPSVWPVYYAGASADGSKVFFVTQTALTADAQGIPQGNGDQELYMYDTDTGTLTRISHGSSGTATGNVDTGTGNPDAISADGSAVYFAAVGVLTSDAPTPPPGGSNLYRYDTITGTTTFIAPSATSGNPFMEVSSDGRFLLFEDQSLTGYDSGGHQELYRYDSADGSVLCVSCNPTGAPALGDSFLPGLVAGTLLSTPDVTPGLQAMSDDGNYVFFDSADALVPQDTNGLAGCPAVEDGFSCQDVYEWEADGTGGCGRADGCVHLISSGTDALPSFLIGASADGSNVFFASHAQLSPWDTDQLGDIYDARINGGFPPPVSSASCSGDGCQGQLSAPPALPAAASVSFVGPGNATGTASTGKVKVLNKTVEGARFTLTVRAPARGRITVTGAGIDTARRRVAVAGSCRITVTLTSKERRALEHRRKLKLNLRVGYAPADGLASIALVPVTVRV